MLNKEYSSIDDNQNQLSLHWHISDILSGFACTLKVLEFQKKNSRPWRSLKITVTAGKSLKFVANLIQHRVPYVKI